jgi:hypothetical protein
MAPRKFESVMLLHGIRTYASWQKKLGDALSQRGFVHDTYDYGRFSLQSFIRKKKRKQQIEEFYTWYCTVRDREVRNPKNRRDFRPSVVAHSFGTYIVGYALNRYEDITLGKLIFCGAILPCDFDWKKLFARNQVLEVRNDYGVDDCWSRYSRLLVRDSGSSGADGFTILSPLVRNGRFELFGHSDYFQPGHYDQWIQFLEEPLVRFRTIRSSELAGVREWGDIAVQTRAIDKHVYGHLKGYADTTIPEGLSTKWLAINPDIYTILLDHANRVHGYVNAMPLCTEAFEKIISGSLTDDRVAPRDIVTYSDHSEIDLYLMSIAIHPGSRRLAQGLDQSAFHRLLYGLTHRLEELARDRGLFVRRFGAVGWTDEGRRLCEVLGMREHGKDKFNNPTYVLDLTDNNQPRLHSSIRDLRHTYSSLRSKGPTV